jgi:outer membrane protein OmpA-like peptidoglycan-associated protein
MKSFPIFFVFLFVISSCCFGQHSRGIYFRAEKTGVQKGETINLRWRCKGYRDIEITGVKEGLPETGSIDVTPDTTTVYKLIARKSKNKQITKRITAVVNSPSFSYITLTDSATDESPVSLKWKALNAEKVIMDGSSEVLPLEGTMNIHLDSTGDARFTAINAYGKSTEKVLRIRVRIIERCYALPEKIIEKDTAKLFWNYKNTSSVNIEGLIRSFNPQDSLAVVPDSTMIYTITALRNDSTKRTDTVSVRVYPAGIASFKGSPTIFKGNACTLRWITRGAKNVILTGGEINKGVPLTGSLAIKPPENTVYTLTAFCDERTDTKQFRVNVIERSFVDSIISINHLRTGQRMDFEIFEVDRSKYPAEIKLKVMVVDTAGNFISGLAPESLDNKTSRKYFKSIIEIVEKKSIPIKNFTVREVHDTVHKPDDMALTLDYSGSMSGTINELAKSTKRFVAKKSPFDRLSLVVFDAHIGMLTGLEKDKDRILKAFAKASYEDYGTSTSLYAAADQGMRTLENSMNNKLLLLFTDGYENSSFLHSDSLCFTPQDVVAKARSKNIHIDVIAFGDDVNTPLLEYLSMLTDGNMYKINRNKDILRVYQEIPIISRNYYEISYKPSFSEGEREIRLSYFNQNATAVAKKKMFIGENYVISDWRMGDNKYKYIDSIILTINKPVAGHPANSKKINPVAAPQAIAFFDYDKYIIRANDEAALAKCIAYLKINATAEILLLGHTDLRGTDKSCDALSQNRADAVKDYLIKSGINKERIYTAACGKRYPVNALETDENKAQENRRVEAVLLQ